MLEAGERPGGVTLRPDLLLPLCLFLLLAGCGGSAPVTPPAAAANPNSLAGNWLLFGTLPKTIESTGSQPGFGVTLDVIGSNLLAAAAISTTCTGTSTPFGLRLGAAIVGTIASDGSFSASSPQGGFPTLSIQGKAPATAGSPWSGSYTLTSTNTLCPVNQSGSFTATPVQDLNGTYAGTGNLSFFQTTSQINISMTLSQGAPLYSPIAPTPVSSRLGVAGSIQIQGISCFSKGTTSTVSPSEVEGGPIMVNFAMDDGSTLSVAGGIDDTAASSLDIDVLEVRGGACAGIYSFGLNALVAKH